MTTTERVTHYLGSCDMRRAAAGEAARALAMSTSILRHRLQAEGTTFSSLVKAERARRVQVIMQNKPRIGAKRLADALGYSCANGFYRAFPAWFGQTYTEFRRGYTGRQTERPSA